MPVVPFVANGVASAQPSPSSAPQPPAEEFALMAAAQMHAEGRLIAPEESTDDPVSE